MAADHLDDIFAHKTRVAYYIERVVAELLHRALVHDHSKLEAEEYEAFAAITPVLARTAYGTEEYRAALRSVRPAIAHHYAHNRHHPEYHPNGVSDMSLIDVIEMVCDWLAAADRQGQSPIGETLPGLAERFALTPQLATIIAQTIAALGTPRA